MKTTILKLSLITSLIISCSQRDNSDINSNAQIELSPSNLTIKSNESPTFTMKKGTENLNPNNFTWTTSNEYIAKFNNTMGVLNTKLIGDIQVYSKDKQTNLVYTSNVKILPIQSFFKEPVLLFGKMKSEIKSNETRTLLSETLNNYNHTILTYKGENPDIEKIVYEFYSGIPNSSELGLSTATVYFRKDLQIENKISQFYQERYIRDSNIITDWWGYDINKTIEVGVMLNSTANPNAYRAHYSKY